MPPEMKADPRLHSGCMAGAAMIGELEAMLASRAGRGVHIRVPQRGEGRKLMVLAGRNAAETLEREQLVPRDELLEALVLDANDETCVTSVHHDSIQKALDFELSLSDAMCLIPM